MINKNYNDILSTIKKEFPYIYDNFEMLCNVNSIFVEKIKNFELIENKYSLCITYEETLKWKQFLIAKGCDPLFNKNPYLQFDTDSFVEKLIGEIDKERNNYTKILCENTTISNNAKEHYACCLDCFTKIRLLVEELSKK